MKWSSFPLKDGLGEWKSEWDALNSRVLKGHPLSDGRFVGALLDHFRHGDERLLVAQQDGRVSGMLILRAKGMGRWESFLPAQSQIAPVLVENEAILSSLFEALPSRCWMVSLLCQDPNYFCHGAFSTNLPKTVQPRALTMNINLDGTFEGYWHARSKNLQKNMKRHSSRLVREGLMPELRIVRATEQMRDAVAAYSTLESTGWKANVGTAVNFDNPQGQFYTQVLEQFAATGQARVYEYRVGDALWASRLVLSSDQMSIILKTSYDETFKHYSPGTLLLQDLIRQEFADAGHRTLEFYTDASSEQLAWCTGQRHVSHVSVFPGTLVKRVYETLTRARHRIAAVEP